MLSCYNKFKIEQQEITQSTTEEELSLGDLDDYINYGIGLLRDLPNFWNNSIIEIKNKLGLILFPEGLYYLDKSIGTTKISTVLRVFNGKNSKKSIMVSEGGLEPP